MCGFGRLLASYNEKILNLHFYKIPVQDGFAVFEHLYIFNFSELILFEVRKNWQNLSDASNSTKVWNLKNLTKLYFIWLVIQNCRLNLNHDFPSYINKFDSYVKKKFILKSKKKKKQWFWYQFIYCTAKFLDLQLYAAKRKLKEKSEQIRVQNWGRNKEKHISEFWKI